MSNFRHVDDLGSHLLTSNINDANNVNLTNRFLLFCKAKCESSLALAYISMLSHKSKIKPRSCDTRLCTSCEYEFFKFYKPDSLDRKQFFPL